jgi:hypothetical protein
MQDIYTDVAKVVARWEKKTGKIIKYNFTVDHANNKKIKKRNKNR